MSPPSSIFFPGTAEVLLATLSRRMSLTLRSTLSPTEWPSESLTRLNWSRSTAEQGGQLVVFAAGIKDPVQLFGK